MAPADVVGRYLPQVSAATMSAVRQEVAEGKPLDVALRRQGVGRRLMRLMVDVAEGRQSFMVNDKDVTAEVRPALVVLLEELDHAQADFEAEQIEKLLSAADTPDRGGRYDWRPRTWIMEHAPDLRRRYGLHSTVEIEATALGGSAEHQRARRLSDAELREELPQEWAELMPPEGQLEHVREDGQPCQCAECRAGAVGG